MSLVLTIVAIGFVSGVIGGLFGGLCESREIEGRWVAAGSSLGLTVIGIFIVLKMVSHSPLLLGGLPELVLAGLIAYSIASRVERRVTCACAAHRCEAAIRSLKKGAKAGESAQCPCGKVRKQGCGGSKSGTDKSEK